MTSVAMTRKHISIFGNFGTQNLGNEYTLQAMIQSIRRYLPDATVSCICSNPDDTSARYDDVSAFRMSPRYGKGVKSRARARRNNALIRNLRRLLISIPAEVMHWLEAFKTLKGTNMLVMTGTGMLGDFGIGPFDLHYEILKWSIIARLRGCKVLFVSVGAGRIDHSLSRWLVKSALSLADYRSYRDGFSKACLESIGFNTSADFLYPDLAFSLPALDVADLRNHSGNGRVIGLGLMEYYGKACSREHGEDIYQDYLRKISAFAGWLLKQKYTVRLLVGDLLYDTRVKHDVITILNRDGWSYEEGQLIDEPISSVEGLLAQLAATDLVVATRFHNVLLALMLNKPVVSISYDPKNDALMAGVGLAEYCQHIEHLDVKKLIDQFIALEENNAILKPFIEQRAEEFRRRLDEQYTVIFSHC